MPEKESLLAAGTQHTALTRATGYAVLPRTLIEFTGPDRANFLHNLTTNQVKGLAVGSGCELFFPTLQGKVLAHGYLFCQEESLVFGGVAGQAPALLKHLDKYRIREKVEFHERTEAWTNLALAGPTAAALLERLTGSRPPQANLAHAAAVLGEKNVRLRHVDFLGASTFFITAQAVDTPALASLLENAGASSCARLALDMARLEAGFPEYGRDITPDHLCQEVNRTAQAISFTKGCYLGQETIARIDSLGHVNKLLVGLAFSGETVPEVNTEVQHEGKTVGAVTSAAFSPRLGAPLALGYVRTAQAAAGTRLESALGGVSVVKFPVV